jgi:membrane-associated HD superfamily phosphohydrolase
MKKKISIGVVVIALIVGIYLMFAPSPVNQQRARESQEVKQAVDMTREQPDAAKKQEEQEARRKQMQEEYAVLEKERAALQKQLDDVRASLFDVKLPAKQAKELNEEMMTAYLLLRNPPMLGAFHNVEDIGHEIDKVKAAQNDMVGVAKKVEEIKKE